MVKLINLDTGEFLEFKTLEQIGIGSYVFWRCTEEVLSMKPDVLREAMVVMVDEPGKSRTVTKAHAALKTILDCVNGICSQPLRKGIESSSSGMGKSNHGWNSFTSFYDDEEVRKLAFTIKNKRKFAAGPNIDKVEYEYERCWMSFTDFSEATDKADHKISSFVSEQWMKKCGIPTLLRGIVHETCFKPRKIYFHATGVLRDLGTYDPVKGMYYSILRKGILMGDPLTKVCLHLTNKIARDTARILSESDKTLDLLTFKAGVARLTVANSVRRGTLRNRETHGLDGIRLHRE